jgi:hypothetical protein
MLAAVACVSQPASSGSITNLKSHYAGYAHHDTLPARENVAVDLSFEVANPDGTFRAHLGDLPIRGRFDAADNASFSGKSTLSGGVTVRLTHGKMALSATGKHLLGSFEISGDSTHAGRNGKYTLVEHALVLPSSVSTQPPSEAGGLVRHPRGGIGDLAQAYHGYAHSAYFGDYDFASFETWPIELLVTNTKPNGRFKGTLDGFQISGWVSSTGRMTFNGDPYSAGKAQMSATGRFIVGGYDRTPVGADIGNGPYTLELEAGRGN